MRILLIVSLLLSTPVLAQEQRWTPAPVPSAGDPKIMPAARVGEPVSDDHSTPFSSTPSDSVAANGATSADVYNGVQTPNLSK